MYSALALFLLSGAAMAQTVVINSVTAQSPVHYADDADFSAGVLTVTFNMNTGTTAKVAIDLADDIVYIPNSVTVQGGGATVVQDTGHTAVKPRFVVTGTAGSTVTFKIK